MATFICDCGYSTTPHKVKFKNVDGELTPEEALFCPFCHGQLKLQLNSVSVGEIEFAHNKFDSLSNEQKKEVLKIRAKKHFDKFSKAEVERKRQETISGIKQKFEGGIQR